MINIEWKYWIPSLLMIIISVFFQGIINKTRAITSGRKGPGLLQSLKDVTKLFKKGAVFSTSSSYISQIAPSIYFASVLAAMMVIPFAGYPALLSFKGDFIFFAYILGIGKLFLILGALDAGSPFQGMGANREALFSTLVEPAFFVLWGSFAMLTGQSSFIDIYSSLHYGSDVSYLLGGMAAYILGQIAMVENSRLPVDDPRTHLELTMTHEVMILDVSGFDLGLIFSATALKFALYGTLITNFFVNPNWHWSLSLIIFFVCQIVFAVSVGIAESFRARARMKRNPQLILSLTSISILIFFGALIVMNKFL
ncbi:MAG: formate hydrogenlyase [Cytophagales bacterium]|nr:MAG: formate hydrogenlyase [Cytophagales bacterium]